MGSFKLGKMTLQGLFKEPETVQYPAQVKTPPPGLKGRIRIEVERCILCGVCMRRCPTGALSVDKAQRSWSINRFRCVQCASCVRECPKSCLTMEPSYTSPAASKHRDAFDVPEAEKHLPKGGPSTRPAS